MKPWLFCALDSFRRCGVGEDAFGFRSAGPGLGGAERFGAGACSYCEPRCCVLCADKPFKRDACFVAGIWIHPALSSMYRSPFSDNAAILNVLFIEIKWTFFFPPIMLLEKMMLLPCPVSQTGFSH